MSANQLICATLTAVMMLIFCSPTYAQWYSALPNTKHCQYYRDRVVPHISENRLQLYGETMGGAVRSRSAWPECGDWLSKSSKIMSDPFLRPVQDPPMIQEQDAWTRACTIDLCQGGQSGAGAIGSPSTGSPPSHYSPSPPSQAVVPPAPPPQRWFSLIVCNHSSDRLWLTLLHWQNNQWIKRGWYPVSPGDCDRLGAMDKGMWYYYAYNKNGHWGGEFGKCIPRRVHHEVSTSKSSCLADEKHYQMREMFWNSDGEYTLTLNGR